MRQNIIADAHVRHFHFRAETSATIMPNVTLVLLRMTLLSSMNVSEEA